MNNSDSYMTVNISKREYWFSEGIQYILDDESRIYIHYDWGDKCHNVGVPEGGPKESFLNYKKIETLQFWSWNEVKSCWQFKVCKR